MSIWAYINGRIVLNSLEREEGRKLLKLFNNLKPGEYIHPSSITSRRLWTRNAHERWYMKYKDMLCLIENMIVRSGTEQQFNWTIETEKEKSYWKELDTGKEVCVELAAYRVIESMAGYYEKYRGHTKPVSLFYWLEDNMAIDALANIGELSK